MKELCPVCCSSNNSQISGSEVRDKLKKGLALPDWFIRESVLKNIIDETKNGNKIFFK